MSAFVVTDNHIHAILRFAILNHMRALGEVIDFDNATSIGQVLVSENYRSVNDRYSDSEQPHVYTYRRPNGNITAIEFLKALQCLNYQCCETNDYDSTKASKIIQDLISQSYPLLSGYDAAPWTIK